MSQSKKHFMRVLFLVYYVKKHENFPGALNEGDKKLHKNSVMK